MVTNEEEIWRDIPGYEGLYQVSTLGRIKSFSKMLCNDDTERILYQGKNNKGYLLVWLYKTGCKPQGKTVHRLVAEAFLPNPNGLPHVNHKDSNRANPNLNNLEWMSVSDNLKHSYANGRVAAWQGKKFSKEQVEFCRQRMLKNNPTQKKCIEIKTKRIFDSGKAAAAYLSTDYKALTVVMKSQYNKHGIMWLEDYEKLYGPLNK